ncbi:hypothetical protein [Maridesulfovibrio bastinii]|uniref:hypothetical protein n=1 Tax=Maridesulfovibrio bastinii TaxID=47157 RepID=UPI0003F7179A|nr:hypothetical protein [Maridesulfovibrio bastinii]
MRKLIFDILTTAAMAAGLPYESDYKKRIYEAPMVIKDALLPLPRIEIQILKAPVKSYRRSLSKFPTPEKEYTHRTIRKALDQVITPVRLAIVANDENWLKDFAHSLHRDLPRKIADGHNNIVKIEIEAVESNGFGSKLVEVSIKKKLTKVFHLRFTSLVTRDDDVALIKDVEVTPTYSEE